MSCNQPSARAALLSLLPRHSMELRCRRLPWRLTRNQSVCPFSQELGLTGEIWPSHIWGKPILKISPLNSYNTSNKSCSSWTLSVQHTLFYTLCLCIHDTKHWIPFFNGCLDSSSHFVESLGKARNYLKNQTTSFLSCCDEEVRHEPLFHCRNLYYLMFKPTRSCKLVYFTCTSFNFEYGAKEENHK